MLTPRFISRASMIALVLAAGTVAVAEPPRDAPLEGPRVKDRGAPGTPGNFGGNKDNRQRLAERGGAVAHIRALQALRGEQAGENRLTPEQDEQIRGFQDEFRKAQREYLEANRDTLMELRSKLPPNERRRVDGILRGPGVPNDGPRPKGRPGEGRLRPGAGAPEGDRPPMPPGERRRPRSDDRPDGPPPAGEEMQPMVEVDPAEAQAARDALKTLMDAAPQPKEVHDKIWNVLTEAQRPIYKAALDKAQEEMMARAKRGAQPGRPGQGVPPGAQPGDRPDMEKLREELKGKTPDEIMNDPRVPERLRRRIEQLPPEERGDAIRRWLDNAGRPRPEGAGGDGQPPRRPRAGRPDGPPPPPPGDR